MTLVRDEAASRQALRSRTFATSGLAVIAAALAVALLLSGLSYPGFPLDVAVCGVLAAVISVVLAVGSVFHHRESGRGWARSTLVLGLVAVLFTAGLVAARSDDGSRLRARWAVSQPAFEQEVRSAGSPTRAESAVDAGYAPYPGECPARIGEFTISACQAVDGGFLFLQSQGALTDDSGIVYLPTGQAPSSPWGSTETMTSLGGPWWSWTCSC